jgi:hypothetical protein
MLREFPLGRLDPPDFNHVSKFPLSGAAAPPPIPAVVEKIINPVLPRSAYNQGSHLACVGAAASRLTTIDNSKAGAAKVYDLFWLWNEAKKGDGYPNPEQDRGTTVRAAFDVLLTEGHVLRVRNQDRPPSIAEGITEFRWCQSVDEMRAAINAGMPVVIGIAWFTAFDSPTKVGGDFFIGRGAPETWGRNRGGHALCLWGASDQHHAFRFCNSWGNNYPLAWLDYSCMTWQLAHGAEAGVVVDRP